MPHPDGPSAEYAPRGARIAMDEAMAAALNHLGEGVAVLDMESYRLLYVNEALCTILGYESDVLLGLSSFVALLDVQDGDELTRQVDRHRERTHGEAFQLTAFRADGASIRLEASARPFDGPVAGPRVLVAVVRDVTEKHAAAEKLRAAHEELESRVRERTQKMREAIQARDDFLGMASHELRTPMTPLQLEVQAAMRTLRAAPEHVDRAAMLEAMSRVDRHVRRMVKTIDDMLDVSHLKGGRVALDLQRCDLGTITRDVVARFDGPGTPITVRGEASVIGQWDPVRLAQIVTNLVAKRRPVRQGAAGRRGRPERSASRLRDRDGPRTRHRARGSRAHLRALRARRRRSAGVRLRARSLDGTKAGRRAPRHPPRGERAG
jgi:PAS domain S-box-containing protein